MIHHLSTRIKNREELLSHGNIRGRDYAIQLVEHALEAVDAYKRTRVLVRRQGDGLQIGDRRVNLSQFKNIYVIGAGKATAPIARALEETLGERLTAGVIVVKYGHGEKIPKVEVIEAAHPIPDGSGYRGAKEVIKIADRAREGDLVFCVITGGASALLPMPAEGVSLQDEVEVNRMLLTSGAPIDEINTVRNHISSIKGGRLARRIAPAEIVNLIVIDEPSGEPWGPTVPDQSTFSDAIEVLRRHDLLRRLPRAVMTHLEKGLVDGSLESPKTLDAIRLQNVVLADNSMACEAARDKAGQLGLSATIVTSAMEGESIEVGRSMASRALAQASSDGRGTLPHAMIFGGETVVTLAGESGLGGPSQELALSFAREIAAKDITLLAIDTDGTDGPTDVAGGLVDGQTVDRSRTAGLDISAALERHDSHYVLTRLHDAVVTGPTSTNVMDLNVVIMT